MELITRFRKAYANVLMPERLNPIYHDQKYGPVSWHVAYLEITQNTAMGEKIASSLAQSGII